MPTVSIVIPSYNRGYCIEPCIRSALEQTYQNFEIIVVDDASTDDTRTQVLKITDSRIRYLTHETNKGGGAARNTGIRATKGEFVAFLDSDDRWHPRKLEKQILALQTLGPEWGVSYTWLSCVGEDGIETMKISPESEGECFNDILATAFMGSFSNVVVRKSLLVDVGLLDEEFRSCQDWDLFIRLCRQAKVHCLREYAVFYLQSVTDKYRISINPNSVIQGHRKIIDKYAKEYAVLPTPYKKRALGNFMRVFAEVGSVPYTLKYALKIMACKPSFSDVKNVMRLLLRALKRFSTAKIRTFSHA
jgi:glycosyltransferase involved in cell wall biosynthesis